MTHETLVIEQVSDNEAERLHDQYEMTIINQILQKISRMDFPEQGLVQCYMRHKWRPNHKPNSLRNSLKTIELFLISYTRLGKSRLEEVVRDDLEAFVESEQDRGTKITSARTRLVYLLGFLRFLIEEDVFANNPRKITLEDDVVIYKSDY